MLKRIVNEARFKLEIETTGPLLIRSGLATVAGPDMTPVLTFRNGRWQVYIPGSSLKGVTRSHAEKIVRTFKPTAACDPLDRKESCGDKLDKLENLKPSAAYEKSCLVCKLFGSTQFIGRLSLGDAYIPGGVQPKLEQRDGVGIDRLTGGPKNQAKFQLEAVSPGVLFQSDVLLRNFECWQLGLLLAVIQDMTDGLVRLGGGRSRGFGAITARVPAITVYQIAAKEADPRSVLGLGSFPDTAIYGASQSDKLSMQLELGWKRHGLRWYTEATDERISELRDGGLRALTERIDQWPN